MGDISYEDLIKARKAEQTDKGGEYDLMGMANIALKILEQVNVIKGNSVMATRPQAEQTNDQTVKPVVDINQIRKALTMVKAAKGDIKISELDTLIEQNKDMLAQAIGGMNNG